MKYYVKKGFYQFTEEAIIDSSWNESRIEDKLCEDSHEMFMDQNPEDDHDEEYEGTTYEEEADEMVEYLVEEYDPEDERHSLIMECQAPEDVWQFNEYGLIDDEPTTV